MFLGTLSLSLSFFLMAIKIIPPTYPPPLPAHDSYMYPHLFDPDDWG